MEYERVQENTNEDTRREIQNIEALHLSKSESIESNFGHYTKLVAAVGSETRWQEDFEKEYHLKEKSGT